MRKPVPNLEQAFFCLIRDSSKPDDLYDSLYSNAERAAEN